MNIKMKIWLDSFSVCIMLFCGFAILSGCGKKLPAGWPKTYPCTVKVTKNGTALEGAMVILSPMNGSGGNWAIGGITNAAGITTIHTSYTNYSEPGAPEGMFKVTISKQLPQFQDPTPQEELNAMDYLERQAYAAKIDAEANKRPPIVPEKYSDPEQTELTLEVKPNTHTETTFDVE
jgi:hypothetical protein